MHGARTDTLDGIRNAAIAWILAVAAAAGFARPAGAQDDAPLFTPDELEELVAPIALYPDDLVAIVLPAATYPLDVVEAARLLDELEDGASREPDPDWDDSIVALLNYPEVLRLLDEDLDWTWDLGEAFLNQQTEVFDAIQRFRMQAREAGNLASDERVVVSEDAGAIRIAPSDPQVIYVPYYEPREVIVHHHHHYAPIRYYPRPYPVYYYPYPAGYSFWSGYFWGVTTAFTIGWHSHHLHAHHHLHVGHPYHRHRYYDPYYVRRSISVNVINIDRNVYVWQPRQHRIGVRPGRVTVTREGAVRPDYGTRRYVNRGDGQRRTVSSERRSTANSERTIGRIESGSSRSAAAASGSTRSAATASRSPRSAASDRGSSARRDASSSRTATGSRGAQQTGSGARVTTREGIVSALRDAGDRNAGTAAGTARSAAPRAAGSSSGAVRDSRREPSGAASGRSTAAGAANASASRSRFAAPSGAAASSSRSTATSSRSSSSNIGAISSGRSAPPGNAASPSRGNAVSPSRSSSNAGTTPRIASSRSAQPSSRNAQPSTRSTQSSSRSVQPSRSAVSSTARRSVASSRSTSSRSESGAARTRR